MLAKNIIHCCTRKLVGKFLNEEHALATNVYVLTFVQRCRRLANDMDVNVAIQAPPRESGQIIAEIAALFSDWPAINIVVYIHRSLLAAANDTTVRGIVGILA